MNKDIKDIFEIKIIGFFLGICIFVMFIVFLITFGNSQETKDKIKIIDAKTKSCITIANEAGLDPNFEKVEFINNCVQGK